ncbi:MAG TPA: phosphatase PAP2 family protein [Gaiellales bacterium]|jgi:undecaprenyl-diphosphatase
MPAPFLLLVAIAIAYGVIVSLAFGRLAPREGASAAAAEAIEHAAAGTAMRSWWERRLDPRAMTGLALTAASALLIAGGFVVAVLAYLVRGNAQLRSIDSSAAAWGHDHATHASTRLLTWVTDFGDLPLFAIVGVVALVYELRRAPNRWIVPFVVVVVLGDKLITNVIKDLADRARPTLNPLAHTLGPSFPSGHSSTAASFYAALALVMARGRSPRTRAVLAGTAGGIAVAVASSRVLLDFHWVSDVVAGVMLGWAWFALCAIAFGGRHMRYAEPMEQAAAGAVPAGARPTAEV